MGDEPGAAGPAPAAPRPADPGGLVGDIRLLRLDARGDPEVERVRAAVPRLRVAPGQRRLVTEAVETLPRADADPDRFPFAVLRAHEPVGFGIIERGGAVSRLALLLGAASGGVVGDPRAAVLLRAFYLVPEWQNRRIGRTACARLDDLVRGVHPGARAVLVAVSEANRPAVRAYLAGGFAATGHRVLLSATAGPQAVLRRPLR
ncbi:GNAT family N-acetyltransferase [Streptomonospora nanhaiensis]|uniref:GNAT family N-acetyltransferase n=1 Tax=Streptomonospora nanhaiensis TaxID=1323731 RepID=UPI001C386D59|nr:GNAT family N-acetyltransferase [Streptomonospora nanhaiensis]MBV2365626.1 GNAT family N-acetyltransferase [Streptomonospora nanhaiensis]